jgi:hypothetical protein
MSYIKINDRNVLCAGTASPSDLRFDIKELAGKNISWAIGDQIPLADAVARARPGDVVIEVADLDVADVWYFAAKRARGEPVPGEDPEGELLAVLHAWIEESARACGRTRDFESTGFDATSLIFAACDHPHIFEALAFLKPEMHRRYYGVSLNEASRKRIDAWLWKMNGQTRGGYRLWRDQHGWAHVARVSL